MSDYVTDAMVEAGVVAVWNSDLLSKGYYAWETVPITSESRKLWLKDIRAALEAVAPLIAATALRDAADREMAAWEPVPMSPDWVEAIESVCETLRARADQIKKEAGRG